MQRGRASWGAAIVAMMVLTAAPAFGQAITERVSIAASGAQPVGGRYASNPAISGDGLTIVFESPIATLVPNDTNAISDIFVESGGTIARVPAFGGANPDCASQRPAVSANGNRVVFDSCAANYLPAGQDTNKVADVYVYDRTTNAVTRVSMTTGGGAVAQPSYLASISPNGRFVAFLSEGALTAGSVGRNVFLRDLDTNTTYLVSRASGNASPAAGALEVRPSVADDGSVAFASTAALVPGETGALADIFVRRDILGGSPTTTRVSLSSTGAQLSAGSFRPSISADGRFVSFDTTAAAVPEDTNGVFDVYVRDTTANTTVLASRTTTNTAGNASSFEARLSPNGAFVVFSSQATNLDGAFDTVFDVFRAELSLAGGTLAVTSPVRISTPSVEATGSSSAPSVANAGRVAFASDDPNLSGEDINGDTDVFAGSGGSEPLERISRSVVALGQSYSGASTRPAPSYDGTIVAFLSSATNLVSDDTNGAVDVFIRNRRTGFTERLPIPSGFETTSADWVSISHDGRFVTYARRAVFLHDRFSGTTTQISAPTPAGGTPPFGYQPRISASGRYVVFVSDTPIVSGDLNDGISEIYRYDRLTGGHVWVTRDVGGGPANNSSTTPAVSADGRFVVFVSAATDLVAGDPLNGKLDVFVRDLQTSTTRRLSTNVDGTPTGTDARDPFISADGQYVTYLLSSTELTNDSAAPSDVYVIRTDGTGLRGPVSRATEGDVSVGPGSYDPTLSMFGRYLTFRSYRTDLVTGDTNQAADVFGRQLLAAPGVNTVGEPVLRLSVSTANAQATGGTGVDTENPEINGNGTAVAYQSGFTNLVAGDTNQMVDAFIRDRMYAGECTFLEATIPGYAAWVQQFGIDPCSNEGSPFGDPDGDGFTNNEERTSVGGDGNPALGAFTRYFAEGATKTGALNFDVRIALANPSSVPVTGEISYQLASGAPVAPTPFSLAAFERKTVQLDTVDGIAETGPAVAYEFATTVRASAPIGIDRLMTWDKNTYAGHAETGVTSTATAWYFAEGATISGFNLFYLLQNPSAQPVTVQGRYLLTNGQTFSKEYTLPANSRFNIWANVEQIGGATPLSSAEFSAVFTVTAGAPIIAERAMYLGNAPLFKAGHESAGITQPAVEWFLAEGNAGDFFDHFVLVGNTTTAAALVEVEYIVGNSTQVAPGTYTKQYTVGPNSRFNIWVDEQEIAGGFPFRTGRSDISVRLRSINGVPLIVERAMWWPGNPTSWYEAHNSPGAQRTAARWVLAEGENGGALGWETYILVANTGEGGSVGIRLLLPNGQTAQVFRQLNARSRQTYPLAELLAEAGLPANTQAGVLVESQGAALDLVVERAMYRSVAGQFFQLGTNALGTPLP